MGCVTATLRAGRVIPSCSTVGFGRRPKWRGAEWSGSVPGASVVDTVAFVTPPHPRRNRVDPFGDLHAVAARGMFTGNRGCLVDEQRRLVRHHTGNLWITCLTEFRAHHHELDAPRHWTPLFFLDEAVALAAGHRPCAYCRRADYRSYRDALAAAGALPRTESAATLNRVLAGERLRVGRGLHRAKDRRTHRSPTSSVPDGAVIIVDDVPHLVLDGQIRPFSFEGWGQPRPRPSGTVTVVTPPTSVAALTGGYRPVLHPSAIT